jgi:hypothetical protein
MGCTEGLTFSSQSSGLSFPACALLERVNALQGGCRLHFFVELDRVYVEAMHLPTAFGYA